MGGLFFSRVPTWEACVADAKDIDLVVNCAAMSSPRQCEDDEKLAKSINVPSARAVFHFPIPSSSVALFTCPTQANHPFTHSLITTPGGVHTCDHTFSGFSKHPP